MGSKRKRWKVIAISKIREIRKRKGLSQKRLAELAGIAKSTMSEIETGITRIKPGQLKRIAEALEVDVDDLQQK